MIKIREKGTDKPETGTGNWQRGVKQFKTKDLLEKMKYIEEQLNFLR